MEIGTILENALWMILWITFFVYSGMLYVIFRLNETIRINFIPIPGGVYGIAKVMIGFSGLVEMYDEWGFLIGIPFVVYPWGVRAMGGYIGGLHDGYRFRDIFWSGKIGEQ